MIRGMIEGLLKGSYQQERDIPMAQNLTFAGVVLEPRSLEDRR